MLARFYFTLSLYSKYFTLKLLQSWDSLSLVHKRIKPINERSRNEHTPFSRIPEGESDLQFPAPGRIQIPLVKAGLSL